MLITAAHGSYFEQQDSNLSRYQHHLDGFLQHRLIGYTPRVSNSVGLVWTQEFAFPTIGINADAGPHTENHCFRDLHLSLANFGSPQIKPIHSIHTKMSA